MELNLTGVTSRDDFERAGILLPTFDVQAMQDRGKRQPRWIHLGPGNIFRVFPARIAHDLLEAGEHWPVTGVVPLDPRERDEQLGAHDLMTLSVTLNPDGSRDMKVIAGLSECVAWARPNDWGRLCDIIEDPGVTLFSMTITEKGYAIHDSAGKVSDAAKADIAEGPDGHHSTTMARLASLLVRRFRAGGHPINMLSFDNFSHNGDKLRASLLEIIRGWVSAGALTDDVRAWVEDSSQVSFPITVIDKITPRPNTDLARELSDLGFVDMDVRSVGGTPLAGFVNAEPTEYLIIEDVLVGDVPDFAAHGVEMASRQVCDDFEHMKVTTCLNPLHTALAVAGVLLGYDTIDSEMRDESLSRLVHRLGWDEGLPVVVDPGIVSPEDFLTEVLEVRFPNRYLPDSPSRIAMDTSQKVPIRFGETVKKYMESGRDLGQLSAIPLVFALWMRYLLAVDDEGNPFEPSPDPLLDELQAHLADVSLGGSDIDIHGALQPILSNASIFGVNLYETPLGDRVEELFALLVAGKGAVRTTLDKEMNS